MKRITKIIFDLTKGHAGSTKYVCYNKVLLYPGSSCTYMLLGVHYTRSLLHQGSSLGTSHDALLTSHNLH